MSGEYERYAIYWVPGCDDALARFGADWNGWCSEFAHTGDRRRFASLSFDVSEVARDLCRHGLHAALRAPFRLAEGRSQFLLEHAVTQLAENAVATPLPELCLAVVDGRVSLAPRQDSPAVVALSTRISTALWPLAAAAPARGFAESPAMLAVNGTGSVIELPAREASPFHVPLTDRLDKATAARVLTELRPLLQPILQRSRWLHDIALMGDPGNGRPMRLLQRYELRTPADQAADHVLDCVGPEVLAPSLESA